MQIDVTKLLTNQASTIPVEDTVIIPQEMITDYRIIALNDIIVSGKVTLNEENELILNADLKGVMILKDDITLEPVEHHFETDFEEILTKNQNILDITNILWQNILVEIPSKVRATDEDVYLSGDGWRVISEKTYNEERNKVNNPFANLDELLKTKEDK